MLSNIPPVCLFKMCASKNRYATYRTAKRKLKLAQEARRNKNKSLRLYQCPICDGWHMTKQLMTTS